ncbi:MAG: hypothetical protein U1E05_24975 [Patescibacteria group bacterium]|nr:hypothetical protein [Patescibacteria group bacterium]
MTTGTKRIVLLVIGALSLVMFHFCVLAVLQVLSRPAKYRLAFSATKRLTERDAIEVTKRALVLDGKQSHAMRPVPSGHKDADGREVFFCRKNGDSDEGWVLWWLERPDHEWDYLVGITREGDEVVCTISKPL